MKREWYELPANAKTVMDVQCCIDFLEHHHPYPANMKLDRKNSAILKWDEYKLNINAVTNC